MLSNATIQSLMKVKKVQEVLGTTRRINRSDCQEFYKCLQGFGTYIDG